MEDAVARHDQRTLGGAQQRHGLIDRAGVRIGLRFGAVFGLVVEVLDLAGVAEPGVRDLGGEIEMHRLGHAAAQLSERVPGVFVHTGRGNEPLAVLAHPLGRRLLIRVLDPALRILCEDRLVAGQHQNRGAGRIRRGNAADHVGEAGTFRAGGRRHLAGHPRERVGSVAERTLVATAIGWNPDVGNGVDHAVVAGTTEERRHALFLAGPREHLGAGHREIDLRQRGVLRRLEFGGNAYRLRVFLGRGRRHPCRTCAQRGRGRTGAQHRLLHEPAPRIPLLLTWHVLTPH